MIHFKTLSNGIRVIVDQMQDLQTVSMGIWVGVGARYETIENNGISHLLEHMAFKGTPSRDAFTIARDIENVGGIMNAYTSRDLTCYYVKLLKDDFDLGLSILSDIFQYSTMDEIELEKEKSVIIQEINQTYDTPDDAVFEYFSETSYPNQAMGRSILGTKEIVSSISSEQLRSYMTNQYTADRVVVSVAGNVNPDMVFKKVEKTLTDLKKEALSHAEKSRYAGGYLTIKKPTEQVNILMGFNAFDLSHQLYYPAQVLSTLLGGGMSSRLFQEIREKRGLVYTIYSFVSSYTDTGVFGIYAGTGEKEVAELIPAVCHELNIISSDITSEELIRAKNQIKSNILMQQESSSARADNNARRMILQNKLTDIDDIISQVDRIQITDIQTVAQAVFSSTPTITALGPIDQMPAFDQIKAMLKHND